MITNVANVNKKGAALCWCHSFGYPGSFLGGISGGYLLLDSESLGMVIGGISMVWFLRTLMIMKNPTKMAYLYLPLAELDNAKAEALVHDALVEWHINETEFMAVFKFKAADINIAEFKMLVIKDLCAEIKIVVLYALSSVFVFNSCTFHV